MTEPLLAARPAHLGWRLLATAYDFLPALALWFFGSVLLLLLRGGQPVAAGSLAAWAELLLLWSLTGAYAVASWRRGGQTLALRALRLKVVAADGGRAAVAALCLRYAVATVSLAALGLGFWWSLFERERRTWHDLASGTRLVRLEAA